MSRTIKRSAIQRLKKSHRKDSKLINPLTRHVMRKMAQEDGERRQDVMHPSEMSKADWCGRKSYYTILGVTPQRVSDANPSFTMSNILTEGTNIHTKYQTWLWEMGVLYGRWECRECSYRWDALSPEDCPECSSVRLRYKEVPLENKKYLIGGHADGAVHDLLEVGPVMIEVKSIGIRTLAFEAPRLYQQYLDGTPAEEIWFQINRPFGSHLKQGTFYLWLARELGLPYEYMLFIYESKFNQQVKEFLVKFNPTLIAPRLEEAKDVAQGVRAGIAPDHPDWAAPDGPVCQSCVHRNTCWNKESDENDQPKEEPLKVVRAPRGKRQRALAQARV